MKRLAAMHDWPLLIVRALTAVVTASSSFAEGMTIKASLPPSSNTVFFDLFAGHARHTSARRFTACQSRRDDARIIDYLFDHLSADQSV